MSTKVLNYEVAELIVYKGYSSRQAAEAMGVGESTLNILLAVFVMQNRRNLVHL